MELDNANVRAATVRALQQIRHSALDTQALRDRRAKLLRELSLLDRQLHGDFRPVARFVGIQTLEHIPPARGRYRDKLLSEQRRIISQFEFLELAIRHLGQTSPGTETTVDSATASDET